MCTATSSVLKANKYCNVIHVHQQPNLVECGLYAIANVTALAFGDDPEENVYKDKEMRSHLRKCKATLSSCFEALLLMPFPTKRRRKTKQLYCLFSLLTTLPLKSNVTEQTRVRVYLHTISPSFKWSRSEARINRADILLRVTMYVCPHAVTFQEYYLTHTTRALIRSCGDG